MNTANQLSKYEPNAIVKHEPRAEYVFRYLLYSFLKAEQEIHETVQNLGVACTGDVTFDQSLISIFEKDLEKLSGAGAGGEQTVNEYFEDHFNLALSNLSQNIPSLTNRSASQATGRGLPLAALNSGLNSGLNSSLNPEQFSFKLPDHDKENIQDDVVLKLTQHLQNKMSLIVRHLKEAIEMNKNPEFQALRERNIELSGQLKEECRRKDELVQKLIDADRQASEYFEQLQQNEEELKNLDALRTENEELKRMRKQQSSEYRKLCKDREELEKFQLMFKNNLPDLQKKLKSDLENSKQQIELIERERDKYEQQLNDLKAEKERQVEMNLKLVKELELQKENFEAEIRASQKQLDSQKKYIESQTQERECEIDDYVAKMDTLQEKLKERESKELNYLEKIRQFEEQIESLSEERQKLDDCYNKTCTRLAAENQRNKQLQNLLGEYEKTKEKTQRAEQELKERISNLEAKLYSQLKLNDTLIKSQSEQSASIRHSFMEQVTGGEEVEQLRFSHNESNPMKGISFLNDHSKQSIQETLQEQPSDSQYNSSSIDLTFPDAKRLEERNGKLNQAVEQVIRVNNDLNDELKEVRRKNEEMEGKIETLKKHIERLKEDLERMKIERTVIESSIVEKENKLRELKHQLEQRELGSENEAHLRQSIESLKRKLLNEEEKVKLLNAELKRTDENLTKKQQDIYQVTTEIERVKTEKCKVENEKGMLMRANKKLHEERAQLLHEIEELQNERDDEFEENHEDIKEMFETVLQDKDEEIENLNGCLNEISQKLRDCLPTSTIGQSSLTLLDELISHYQRYSKHNQNVRHTMIGNRAQQPTNNRTRCLQKQPSSESYDSLSPIESCEDQLTSDEDDLCNKLAGIHNNSVEICNLSFHFKNEKGLIKLINQIPEIVTNERLSKKQINEWQSSFVDCFSNRNIAQLLTKNIISLRSTYLTNARSPRLESPRLDDPEKAELLRQLDECRSELRSERLKVSRCNANRKALVFQKKYLMNLTAGKQPDQWLFNNRHQQIYRRQSSSRSSGKSRFRIVAFAVIAANRIQSIKRQRELIESYDQSELLAKVEQLNQLTRNLTDVLAPSVEQNLSFINSLHPNKVPFKLNKTTHHANDNHLDDAEPNKTTSHHSTNHPLRDHHQFRDTHQLRDNHQHRDNTHPKEPHHPPHLTNRHPSTSQQTRATLKNLLDNLKDVYEKLGLEDTLFTNYSSSCYSSLSNLN